MRIFRGLVVALLGVALLLAAVFHVLASHSVTQVVAVCSGSWMVGPDGTPNQPDAVALVISEYRPWIAWTDSAGNVTAEAEEAGLRVYYPYLERIGEPPLTDYRFGDSRLEPRVGGYRRFFRELTVQFGQGLVFNGMCSEP